MKIFFKKDNISDDIPRYYLSDWIKPIYKYSRHSLYGLDPQDLILSDNPFDAEALILPLSWNYYYEKNKINDAIEILNEYENWDKPVYTWSTGDFTLKIPIGNYILFRHSCYKSMRRKNEHAYPVIIKDPLSILKLKKIKILSKDDKPKVGFCGITETKWVNAKLRSGKKIFDKYKNLIIKPYIDHSYPTLSTKLRSEVLKLFLSTNDITSDFILRDKSSIHKKNKKHKLEFLENMLTTNYVICVRGAGNFSSRFYETLAMGRIPILINTDCILPLDNQIDWDKHCIIINEKDIFDAVDILIEFHNNLSDADFKKLQIKNRVLWEDRLTFNGFYQTFIKNEE